MSGKVTFSQAVFTPLLWGPVEKDKGPWDSTLLKEGGSHVKGCFDSSSPFIVHLFIQPLFLTTDHLLGSVLSAGNVMSLSWSLLFTVMEEEDY